MFKAPFSFDGRIRRTEYGISLTVYYIIYLIILFSVENATFVLILFNISTLWLLWAQGAKRCHDLGKSGWWQIIPFYFFWLLFEPGQVGQNKYGEDPKASSSGGYSGSANNTPFNPPAGNGGFGYQGGHNAGSTPGNVPNSNPQRRGSGEYQGGNLYS